MMLDSPEEELHMGEMKRNIELTDMLSKAEALLDKGWEISELQRAQIVELYAEIDKLERKIAELKKQCW